jgi:hypothetical protein
MVSHCQLSLEEATIIADTTEGVVEPLEAAGSHMAWNVT